jgi:hypothetical protein
MPKPTPTPMLKP